MVKSLSIKFANLYKLEITVHAAKYPNVFRRSYGTLVEGKRSTTIPMSGFGKYSLLIENNKIKVEILNIQINRSRAQSQMA